MADKPIVQRDDYAWFRTVTTRWMDNDVYGHVNNAHYYSYFDTSINAFLIARGGLDIRGGAVVGYVVSSACSYYEPAAYPEDLEVGLRADRVGNSSVHYGVGLFRAGDRRALAAGTMVHVFVDRASSRPVRIPDAIRRALEAIAVRGPAPEPE